MITAIQAYDSVLLTPVAAAAGAPTAGAGAAAVEGGGNLITGLGGFLAEIVPIERLFFELQTKYAGAVESIFKYITGSGENEELMSDLKEGGGPILMSIVFNPARSMRRLGDFYEAVSSKAPPTSQVAAAVVDKFKDDPIAAGQMISDNLPSFEEFKKGVEQAFSKTVAESLRDKSLYILHEGAVCEQCGGKGGMHESGCMHEADPLDEDYIDEGAVCEQCGARGGAHEGHCLESDMSEMNAGGVPGVGMKLGHNPDGTPTTYAQLKKLRKKQDVYQITEHQNWNHRTLGRIKFK